MNEEYIKVLKVNPMEHPRVVIIPNNITTLNTIVSTGSEYQCRAEALLIAPYVGVIRATDGILFELEGNRKVKDEIVAGTFLVVGYDEHGYIASLPDKHISKYKEHFWNIENYTYRETVKSHCDKFEKELNLMEEEAV